MPANKDLNDNPGPNPTGIRRFYVDRKIDPAGISGTGIVMRGAVFPSGNTVIEWCFPFSNICIFSTFEEFVGIHCESRPETNLIVWIDPS